MWVAASIIVVLVVLFGAIRTGLFGRIDGIIRHDIGGV